ncbi:hypothetical protein WDU94_013369 [Cyamophila willieti]
MRNCEHVEYKINSTSDLNSASHYDSNETVNQNLISSQIKVINKENTIDETGGEDKVFTRQEDNYANVNSRAALCNKTYETTKTTHEILIKNHNLTTTNITSRDITSNNKHAVGGDINLAEYQRQLQDNNKFYGPSDSMFYSNGTYQYEDINNCNRSQPNGDINGSMSHINQASSVYENNISTNFAERQISPTNFNNTCERNKINVQVSDGSYANCYSNFTDNLNNGCNLDSNKLPTGAFANYGNHETDANFNHLNNSTLKWTIKHDQQYGSDQKNIFTTNDPSDTQSSVNGFGKPFSAPYQLDTRYPTTTQKSATGYFGNTSVHPMSKRAAISKDYRDFQQSPFYKNSSMQSSADKHGLRFPNYSPMHNAPPLRQHNATPRYPHQLYHSYPDHRYQVCGL